MKPTPLTNTMLSRLKWVDRVKRTWHCITLYNRSKCDRNSWPEYLTRSIIKELERTKYNSHEMGALRYIIVNQLPTLMACELIEEYNL